MNQSNKDRVLAISKQLDLSHIGSNLSCLPILEEIYARKNPEDIVILDNAHAHLAHLVVRDNYINLVPDTRKISGYHKIMAFELQGIDVEKMIKDYGIHCDRKSGCDASGGSLGHGLGMAIGYAIAGSARDVYCIVSDGSMQEGSNWEALRIANELHLDNLKIHCNFNGYTAVAEIDTMDLMARMNIFTPNIKVKFHLTNNGEGFEGVEGHYKKL